MVTEMGRGRQYFKLIRRPDSNEIFNSEPHQIFALRYSARWSIDDFAGVLYCAPCTVKDWERGQARPGYVYRVRLVQLVERWHDEYLEALKFITSGPKKSIPFEVFYQRYNKRCKSKIIQIRAQDAEAINAGKRLVRRRKVNFKNLEPVDFSTGTPEPAYRVPEPVFRADQPVFVPPDPRTD